MKTMDEKTDPIDTSNTPLCPECEYIVFLPNEDTDGDWYCMECGTAWNDDEVIHRT